MRHRRHRNLNCPAGRRLLRDCNRRCLRGRRSGPDDFSQMLTAYRRAVRAHRRLARLAPSFFDPAVIERERENREEQQRWCSSWEPQLAKVYGVAPEPVVPDNSLPPLPPPRTQRAVDYQLAELQCWLAAGEAARNRQLQRRPHALPTMSQLARLLALAFDLKALALGLNSPNPLPDLITHDYELTDLKRAYGHLCDPAPPAAVASSPEVGEASVPASPIASPCTAPPPATLPEAAPPPPPAPPRCDAWSRLARQCRRRQR